MAVKNSALDGKLDTLITQVALINQSIANKKELCPYREDIHDGVQAKTDVHELAKAVNGKLDGLRKDVKDMGDKVTNNRISIKAWGGLVGGSGGLAALLVWAIENIRI